MLAAMGASPESIKKAAIVADELGIWPENWPVLRVFLAMQTQWRMGMAGPTGLDYSALPVVEGRLGLGKKTQRRVFPALQIMEGEALKVFSEKRQHGS